MKRLLNEDTTRKFMKLANLKPHTESFLEKVEEGKAGDMGRKDVANKASGRWLKEEEEVSEDAELTEENEVTEEDVTEEGMGMAYARDDEEEPMDDAPMDELPPEEEPLDDAPEELDAEAPAGDGDLDVTAIVQAVTDALAQELDSQGHPVDIDVEGGEGEGMDDAPMDDAPMDDAPMDDAEEEPAGEEEDPVLEDFESAGITVEEELDEEYLNEITRRVAQRLLEKTKNNQ